MEKKKKDWGVSRQAEERYLGKTLAVVNDNLENYGREVARMQEDMTRCWPIIMMITWKCSPS